MDSKVVKFYEDSGCLMTYLLDPRNQPTKLLDAQVKAGAESYYNKLRFGEIKARPNQYPGGVWEEAKKVKYDEFVKDNEILEYNKKIIKALDIIIKRLKYERYWLWLPFGLICGGASVYLLYEYGVLLCR